MQVFFLFLLFCGFIIKFINLIFSYSSESVFFLQNLLKEYSNVLYASSKACLISLDVILTIKCSKKSIDNLLYSNIALFPISLKILFTLLSKVIKNLNLFSNASIDLSLLIKHKIKIS